MVGLRRFCNTSGQKSTTCSATRPGLGESMGRDRCHFLALSRESKRVMKDIVIPKLFHWIWFGPKPIPELHQRWIDGWLQLHPGWEHLVWTAAIVPALVTEAQFRAADNFAEMSDIARYEILCRYGGVYVDTDTECLRSIEPLLAGVSAFAIEAGGFHTINTHPLGAIPDHPWLKEVVARLPHAMET